MDRSQLDIPSEFCRVDGSEYRHIGLVMSEVLARHGLSAGTPKTISKEMQVGSLHWPAVDFKPVELCAV